MHEVFQAPTGIWIKMGSIESQAIRHYAVTVLHVADAWGGSVPLVLGWFICLYPYPMWIHTQLAFAQRVFGECHCSSCTECMSSYWEEWHKWWMGPSHCSSLGFFVVGSGWVQVFHFSTTLTIDFVPAHFKICRLVYVCGARPSFVALRPIFILSSLEFCNEFARM